MRSSNAVKEIPMLKEAFNCSLTSMTQLQSFLVDFIVQNLTQKCFYHLKNANDIPRLYRRTNREIPKTASTYVNLAVDVISEFKENFGQAQKMPRQQELVERCVQATIDSICLKYQSIACDLLESVRKMEDSLRKLQRVRKTAAAAAAAASSSSVSDDDKIRIQLYIDIVELGRLCEERFNGYRGDSNYDALLKLVDEVRANMASINAALSNSSQSESDLVNSRALASQLEEKCLVIEETEKHSDFV